MRRGIQLAVEWELEEETISSELALFSMSFPLGIEPVLKKGKESFFLAPLTYSYIYFVNQDEQKFLILSMLTLTSALVMYVEAEMREDLEDDYFEVTPWLWVETINVAFWIAANFYLYFLFVCSLNWRGDATLAGLGLVNLTYLIGWIVDKVYARKYEKHYAEIGEEDEEGDEEE